MRKLFQFILFLFCVLSLHAQTATSVNGIYDTGQSTLGNLISAGSQVQSSATGPTLNSGWYVTYASTNGGNSANTNFTGDAYVVNGTSITNSGYTPNTSNAQWIIAPGASTNSTNTHGSQYINQGGNYLPGNGSTGNNEGIYVYTLAFNIAGSGVAGTIVTTPITINMTLAADDGYTVYANPLGTSSPNNVSSIDFTTSPEFTAIAGQWSNTVPIALTNAGTGDNSIFYIGTNYISVAVDNTNNISGNSNSTTWNESGFLAFDTSVVVAGNEVAAFGRPIVPEPRTYGLIFMIITICFIGTYRFYQYKKSDCLIWAR